MTIGFFFWCAVMALTMCLVLAPNNAPSLDKCSQHSSGCSHLWLLLSFQARLPLCGAKVCKPRFASLLMMTEIIFGSITAALFANEPFGLREITGVLLIASASLVEPLHELIRRDTRNAA